MKTRNCIVGFLLGAVVFLASCQSTVTVRHLVPAAVNMGSYRNIAVASTTLNTATLGFYPTWNISFDDFGYRFSTGYERDSARRAAEIATDAFTKTLQSSGFFTVFPPSETDNYLGIGADGVQLLKQKGVKAIVRSSISYLDLDEHPYSEDIVEYKTDPKTNSSRKYVTGRKYFISQEVTLSFTYLVKDIESGTILTSGTLTGKRSKDTEVARRVYQGNTFNDQRVYSYTYAPSVTGMITSILNEFQDKIARQLMPTWQYSTLTLMGNKPKENAVKDAYRLADNGDIEQAYAIFAAQWQATGHVPSGYNAALMLEASGNLSGAISLMNQVVSSSGNGDAYGALNRMMEAQKSQQEAQNQIDGTSTKGESGVVTTQVVTGN